MEEFLYLREENNGKNKIKKVLEDETIADSVRYWTTQVAAAFCDERLRKGLNISPKSNDIDIKGATEMALSILED